MQTERIIRVRKFDEYQHYKNRRPPWIKFYNSTLEDYGITRLDDASRGHLFMIWLLASRHDNSIPDDREWIAKQISATAPIDWDTLLSNGFWSQFQTLLARC